jgi:hypothetical protein
MKKFKHASLFVLLYVCSSVYAQETKPDRAIRAVKELCLTGTQFDLKADAKGNLTLRKLLPGGEGAVSVNVRESTGAAAIFDEKIRQIADEDIRRCIQPHIKPIIDAILGEKSQSSIEKGYESSHAAERAEAIRNAFEAVSFFRVRLEPDWSPVNEANKNLYLTLLPSCEQSISRPIRKYSKETGKFSEDDRIGFLQGQVSGQTIRFGGGGYSGDLVSTGKDWIFTGSVTCGQYRYKAVFQLR